ncbi:uncharacterized protein GBIM_02890 [Gryllus bimaculatus]|nr:uncharacterized protein GBIM_02890 [Gryllus bimaculatus]
MTECVSFVAVRPLSLTLTGVEQHTVQGSLVTLRCEVKNALPAANVTWYNGTTPYDKIELDSETYFRHSSKSHM